MNRRQALQTIAAGFPAVLRGARRRAGDKPNLLFLWTDEQRADTLSVYGNHRFRMPALNRLASESVVFERCYDTQPVCTPARSSVLTGTWPHANGCLNNSIPLRRETRCLPELLGDGAAGGIAKHITRLNTQDIKQILDIGGQARDSIRARQTTALTMAA